MGQPTEVCKPTDKQTFLNLIGEARDQVLLADLKFSAWLSGVVIAYDRAYAKHAAALKDVEGRVRLVSELALNAAVAFIPGGAGGLIGDATKKFFQGGVFLVDAAKDLGKWAMRSGALVGQTKGYSIAYPAFEARPDNSVGFREQVNQAVKTELANITEKILEWEHAVNHDDKSFSPSFNPVEKVSGWLKLRPSAAAVQHLVTLPSVVPETLQRQFEASLLKSWIEQYAYAAYQDMNRFAWGGWLGFQGSGGAKGKIIAYGLSVGIPDVESRIDAAVREGLTKYHDPWLVQ
jgi:hypothetical protein